MQVAIICDARVLASIARSGFPPSISFSGADRRISHRAMQHFATAFADVALSFLAIPHYTRRYAVRSIQWQFRDRRSLRRLALSDRNRGTRLLFAYLMFRKWYKIALFLLACVVVPLIGNGLRIVGIMFLAHFTNNEYGAGADHLVYGWGFNVAILLVLFWLGSRFSDSTEYEAGSTVPRAMPNSLAKTALVFLSALSLIVFAPAIAAERDVQSKPFASSNLKLPMNLQGWHFEKANSDWQPLYSKMDAKLSLSLEPNDLTAPSPVDLYVAYYGHARAGEAFAMKSSPPWNRGNYSLVSSGDALAVIAGRKIQWQEWTIVSPAGRRIIWTTYWINGHFTSSERAVKLFLIPAALEGREGQALVAISTSVVASQDEARRRLSAALVALKDLPTRLSAANDGEHQLVSAH